MALPRLLDIPVSWDISYSPRCDHGNVNLDMCCKSARPPPGRMRGKKNKKMSGSLKSGDGNDCLEGYHIKKAEKKMVRCRILVAVDLLFRKYGVSHEGGKA